MARIAVIGAGMGAMAAAARLAVAGHQVTVYERGSTHGGGVGRYAREGFAFDTGPGLLPLPAVYRDLFVKTGREPLEKCVELVQADPAAEHVFADGTRVRLPNSSRAGVISALDSALGEGAGARWTDLLTRAREGWDATRRPLLEEPLTTAPDAQAPPRLARDPYPALRRKGLLRRRTPTLAEAAADELRDPRLVALLESYAYAYGLDPATAPAGAAVLPYMEHTFGTWYVRGGMRALADALHRRCEERRVAFRFGTEVLRVLERDGRAVGVETSEGAREADAVVAGVPPHALPGAADGSGPDVVTRAGEDGTARARLTVLLALRGAHPEGTAHRTVVHRADAPPLTVLRPDDPALRPDDAHATAVLSVPVPAAEARNPEYGAAADGLLAAADAAGLELGPRVLWREIRTPADNAAETGARDGLVPAPALAGAGPGGRPARTPNTAPLDGLYLVGGWAHPGGGLAHAGMSGAMAAGLIVEGKGWRGSQ
ncbi:NAD(P)/FAD-dependent oxidoreductase [Streptomyces sp. HNM0574]|uniref:phytoene desaturase family protein n=1 Tax=Streptomyces sp. HNM0574 TaxID=2714954 RepID=UPI00146B8EC7|nr:NAD(P)/FAD-dependent oxidoreductase [Streptomyces sp. HNM0574]NLU67646.1 NAD(P)/FAD-dependent oxidoreductase [Streptomyces sp. HNM0574]